MQSKVPQFRDVDVTEIWVSLDDVVGIESEAIFEVTVSLFQ